MADTPPDADTGPFGLLDPLMESMRDFSLVLDRYRQDLADRCGISVHDSLIMIALLRPGRQHRPSDLADHLGITSGSLTAMLDRLESAQMVERKRHPTDRRSVFVELTDLGVQRLTDGRQMLHSAVLTSVSPELRESMMAGLRQFTHALGRRLDSNRG